MTEPTETDLTFLENEEQTRIYIQLVTPLIQAAVRSETAPNNQAITSLVQTELHNVRTQVTSATDDVLALQAALRQQLEEQRNQLAEQRRQLDDTLKNWNAEDERRYAAFDQRFEKIQTLVYAAEQRGIETEKRLAVVEETTGQRLLQLESRLTKAEDTISTSVAKVARDSATMSRLVSQWLTENKRKEEKNEQEFRRLEREFQERQEDVGNLRADVDGLRGDIATKVTTTDLKVKHIEVQVIEVKQHQTNHQAQLIELSGSFAQFQIQLKSAMWLLNTWGGRAVLITVLTLLGISNLVN